MRIAQFSAGAEPPLRRCGRPAAAGGFRPPIDGRFDNRGRIFAIGQLGVSKPPCLESLGIRDSEVSRHIGEEQGMASAVP